MIPNHLFCLKGYLYCIYESISSFLDLFLFSVLFFAFFAFTPTLSLPLQGSFPEQYHENHVLLSSPHG